MSLPPDAPQIQAVLDAPRRTWLLQRGETWADLVRRKAPDEPTLLHPVDRSHYRSAMKAALGAGESRKPLEAIFLPFWIANNEDEEPSNDEWKHRLVAWADDEVVLDVKLPEHLNFWARGDAVRIRGSFVMPGHAYARGVSVARFGDYVVVKSLVQLKIENLIASENLLALPRPTRVVPAFSRFVEPAVDLSAAPKEIAAAAAEIIRALEFESEGEPEESDAGSGDSDE